MVGENAIQAIAKVLRSFLIYMVSPMNQVGADRKNSSLKYSEIIPSIMDKTHY